ncbi:MAG: ABC-2 type transport system ATP-binding protein [Myxococcota bacterium]|jgi:ABC-2 type transport system ATP-binding protein
MSMITAEQLTKRFGDRTAVLGLSLDIAPGEVFGLLGPNGAGKTTTVRMLTALIAPTSGHAVVNGHRVGADDTAVRQSIGILTETPGLYLRLTARENLRFFARLYGVPKRKVAPQIERYLKLLGLWDRRDDLAGGFSKGMRQKLAIARCLLHEPPVVFLDEPTSALDPGAARRVRETIATMRETGRTVVLCTHNLDEAERLCDRIGILQGSLLRVGTPADLRLSLGGERVIIDLQEETPDPRLTEVAAGFACEDTLQRAPGTLSLALQDTLATPALVRALVEADAAITGVRVERASLEAVYFDLVGVPTDDSQDRASP